MHVTERTKVETAINTIRNCEDLLALFIEEDGVFFAWKRENGLYSLSLMEYGAEIGELKGTYTTLQEAVDSINEYTGRTFDTVET
jgi:hypothetical protein